MFKRATGLGGKQALTNPSPLYASARVNIVSHSKRRARGGSDGLSKIILVFDWARLFRGHIYIRKLVWNDVQNGRKSLR